MKTHMIPQAPLYKPAAAALREHCGKDVIYMFRYDLTADNGFSYCVAALCRDRICFSDSTGSVTEIPVKGMTDVTYVQYVGCAAIECRINGELTELCRTDMKNALAVQTASKQLRALTEGRTLTPRESEETCCPKCGTPYKSGTKTCPICSSKKAVLLRLLPFAKPYKLQLGIAVLLFVAVSAIGVFTPYLNRILIDDYINAANPKTSGFIGIIAALAFSSLFVTVCQSLRGVLLTRTGNKISVDLRRVVYEKVQQLSLSGVSKRTTGEIYTRVTSDTNVLKEFLTDTLPEVCQMALLFASLTGVMCYLDWKLTLMILIPIPLVAMLFYFLRGMMNRMYHRQWQSESDVNTLLHDIFSGIRVIKVFGTEEKENANFDRAAKKVADISKKNERTWNLIMPFANFLLGIGEYVVLFYVGSKVIAGEMGLGELSQFVTYVGMLYGPVRYAAFLPRRITRCMTSLAKVFELLDDKPEITDGIVMLPEDAKGNISFRDVSFGYNNYEDVLKHINIDINHGEMVGLVGRSGVGKSTLINLVMRLYDVTDGSITIDGIDIRDYDQHSLRSQIGVVLQENFLFKGTIYSNIAYAKPGCTHEEVIRAARMANAHSFIMRQPDGYNTIVGERGMTLSGGERQRIAIARAVLRDPKILILDEATASLDTETEKQIQDAINALIDGRTTIAIAHRLSTLRNATKLVVLEKGGVEEVGTHDQLMRSKGRYYKLVMAQRQMSKMKK